MKRHIIQTLCLFTLLVWTAGARAQGTATSPSTVHIALSSGDVFVGGPNDTINGPGPYPIDLDVTGGPWRKQIVSDPLVSFFGLGSADIYESIQNVGTEPWYDWHEILISGAMGVGWIGMVSAEINGLPITYNQTLGGGALSIDSFSQPVLPGDVLTLHKQIITTDNVVGPNVPVFSILQYPTPEPTSATLITLGFAACLLRKRH